MLTNFNSISARFEHKDNYQKNGRRSIRAEKGLLHHFHFFHHAAAAIAFHHRVLHTHRTHLHFMTFGAHHHSHISHLQLQLTSNFRNRFVRWHPIRR